LPKKSNRFGLACFLCSARVGLTRWCNKEALLKKLENLKFEEKQKLKICFCQTLQFLHVLAKFVKKSGRGPGLVYGEGGDFIYCDMLEEPRA
jgi:hypothetical protein